MKQLKCPSCGAALTFDDPEREFMFCSYCGTKILLEDYRVVHVHKNIDYAAIKKEEKEIELAKEKNKHDTIGVIAMIMAMALIVLYMYIIKI